ncbi:MAG: DUF1987 domain-containing protein [Reichenbachiella sp.]|uniref:DUF1987 domain-containing protein n=1 Tax=Reichenbachiella sp. TaxID=2184521 RepID=UPI00326673FE
MKKYFIKPSVVTPSVYVDINSGIIDLRGKCSPENPLKFYNAVTRSLSFVDDVDLQSELKVNLAFVYFNTSSAKCLYTFLNKLNEMKSNGYKISISWFYEIGDEDMRESGLDFGSYFNINFTFKEVFEIIPLGIKREKSKYVSSLINK